jgi:hypothetical protein
MATIRFRRRKQSIPNRLRAEITQHTRSIARRYRDLFQGDRHLKDRVGRLVRALLPPRPRGRGRPGDPTVTRAILIHRKLRRKFPEESPRALWNRVYPIVISGYADMSEVDQRTARGILRERIAWRRAKRHRQKNSP